MWLPRYETANHTPYVVERMSDRRPFQCAECPRSAATDEMLHLVDEIGSQLLMNELVGGHMPPGADRSTWPAWYADAVGEIAARRRMRENAEQAAVMKERS